MQSRLRLSARRILAALTGGSVAGFVAIHAVHVSAVAGAPMVIDFLCRIPH